MDDRQRRPGETATEYAERLLALMAEADQREDEIRRAALQAELDLKRAMETVRQTEIFAQLLQEELQQQKDQSNAQSFPAYLDQVSRLQAHAIRLLPSSLAVLRQQQQSPGRQRSRGNMPLHVQRSSASGIRVGARSASSQPSTSGRTDITEKFYPLRLRRWVGFEDDVLQNGFARIHSALAQQHAAEYGLPSRAAVQTIEEELMSEMALPLLSQEGALNAALTDFFLKTVLLNPASRILNEYLKTPESGGAGAGLQKKIFFNTTIQSVKTGLASIANLSLSDAAAKDSKSKLRKVQPDCIVLCMETPPRAGAPVQLVATAEHKPLHALRASSVSDILSGNGGALPENLIIRLAQEALVRRDKAAAKQLEKAAEGARSSAARPGSSSGSGPGPRRQSLTNTAVPTAAQATSSKPEKLSKQTYFAYALAQAYHYMLMSGMEYGFLATGEVIVFLRIREDDVPTLYYHVSFFPVSEPAPGSQATIPENVTSAPGPAAGDSVDVAALARLPIAQMVSFCDLARHSERRPTSWVVEKSSTLLARFPNLPRDVTAQHAPVPPSQLGRRRRDGDDDDSGNGRNNDEQQQRRPSQPGSHARITLSPVSTRRRPGPRPGSGSGSGPGDKAVEQDISTTFLPAMDQELLITRPGFSYEVRRPSLPYCTQACLLGLVQGGPLDARCPNVDLHRAAGCSPDKHPLSSFELARRIQDQLYDSPEADCEYSRASRGAIGYPFKLTLTGFGYTLIGKGVRQEHRHRLVRESEIYKGLFPLQGTLIPVHLGLIELHFGYPILDDFLQLPYMMLMSYAGESMASSLVEEDSLQYEAEKQMDPDVIHDRTEAARTEQELRSWGLDDGDDNVSNFRWCAEVGRAMRIDFDRAYLDLACASVTSHVSQASQLSASSINTPTTPVCMPDAPSADLQLPLLAGLETQKEVDEPLRKRQKVGEIEDDA